MKKARLWPCSLLFLFIVGVSGFVGATESSPPSAVAAECPHMKKSDKTSCPHAAKGAGGDCPCKHEGAMKDCGKDCPHKATGECPCAKGGKDPAACPCQGKGDKAKEETSGKGKSSEKTKEAKEEAK